MSNTALCIVIFNIIVWGFATNEHIDMSGDRVIAAIESNGCTTNTPTLNTSEIRDNYNYASLSGE